LVAVFSIIMSLSTGSLAFFHTYLVCINQTTYENVGITTSHILLTCMFRLIEPIIDLVTHSIRVSWKISKNCFSIRKRRAKWLWQSYSQGTKLSPTPTIS